MAKREKRVRPALVIVICIIIAVAAVALTGYRMIRTKYTGDHTAYSQAQLAALDEGSLEYKIASSFFTDEQLKSIRSTKISAGSDQMALADTPETATDQDTNGDGVYIEHIYSSTYEGYMMVVKDPSQVSIAINPTLGSSADAPDLDTYVESNNAIGGINGGGFEDSGGTGNGSVPAGIVIMDGKLISGGTSQPILGFTADHKLVATTCTGEEALAMGVVEAVTFGPTFFTNGKNVYAAGTDNLNMLNPRTAIGQQEDGTVLLLVIDGRGPSSFGAKYEDVVQIFEDYNAVNAGNLDGGNSSVMIYNGRYVHYPVSMYDSRSLPSVFLVKGKN